MSHCSKYAKKSPSSKESPSDPLTSCDGTTASWSVAESVERLSSERARDFFKIDFPGLSTKWMVCRRWIFGPRLVNSSFSSGERRIITRESLKPEEFMMAFTPRVTILIKKFNYRHEYLTNKLANELPIGFPKKSLESSLKSNWDCKYATFKWTQFSSFFTNWPIAPGHSNQ